MILLTPADQQPISSPRWSVHLRCL